jgi:arylsulfatase A-like enzyme
VRWPGKVPANVVNDEVAATVDMLPTFAKLAGGKAPDDRPIDGKDIRPLLFGAKDAKSPHEYYLFPHLNGALRAGPWKFYPWPEGADKKKDKNDPPKKGVQLYDLSKDIGEVKNIAAEHPQVVERLQAAYQRMTDDLQKSKLPMEKLKMQ